MKEISRIERPIVIAHRGAWLEAPENSVEAIRGALDVGADWVEVDLRTAADGTIVLAHDESVEGLVVRDCTVQELRAVRSSVATLEEAIQAAAGLGMNLEFKAPIEDPESFLARVAYAIQGFRGSILVSSFWWQILEPSAGHMPGIERGVLSAHGYDPDGRSALAFAIEKNVETVLPQDPAITEDLIHAAHSSGRTIIGWTVDSIERMKQLAGWGIDGIITNDPARARAALAESNVW
jgi:glycerophosphoryl diester phosphodiesterase